MATFVFNPKSNSIVEAQKKGVNTKGDKQYWLDTKTKQRFTTEIDAETAIDQKTGKFKNDVKKTEPKSNDVKKTAPKSNDVKKTEPKSNDVKKTEPQPSDNDNINTTIKVNSNVVKTVPGKVDIDDAFALVSSYFREVTKTNVQTNTDSKGNTTITFTVKTGTKG